MTVACALWRALTWPTKVGIAFQYDIGKMLGEFFIYKAGVGQAQAV